MENYDTAKGFLGVGFKFPIQVSETTGRIMTSSYEEDIKEAIRIIIMTRKGERLMRPDFGCDIHNFAFESMDYTTLKQMERTVYDALMMWEPRIINVEVITENSKEDEGVLLIHISYTVRSTNNPYNLVYPYYLYEGRGEAYGDI